jgi:hypothetical protein
MRSIIGLIGLTLFAAACTRDPLFSGSPRSTHEPPTGRHRADSSAVDDVVPPGEHIYLTAVRFPDGYAWQEDTCAVDGPVWIDLYRDGALVRSVPAGGSVHPDMHRFMDGHLYTDCSIGTETVVSRDGVELFRFEGREALRGFLVREDGVHTLGQDRDGDGFTYRVDGRIVFRSETGTVLGRPDEPGAPGGALAEYGENVCYTCRIPSERGPQYRVMLGGELLHSLQEVSGIRAFGFLNGKPCRVQSTGRRCLLYVDDKSSDLAVRTGESILWCRMTAWEDDILVLFCVSGTAGRRCFLQASDGKTFQGDKEETVEEMLVEGKRVGWTVTGERGDLFRVRWSDGTATEAAGGYLISGRCALLRNGHLLLALTGRDGAPNRFQQDKEKTDIPFNGYFTSVTVE